MTNLNQKIMKFKIYIKCFFVFIFFICTSKKNAFGQADSISVILCEPWLKNAYTEFETIYPCDTTSYFGDPFGPTIQSGKKDSIHYIHIRKLIVLPPPFFTFYYESKYFTLDGIYLGDGTFDAQGNGFAGDLEENETLLYHCKDVYPDCCSTEIEMVSLTDNCGLAPRIVSTGEILRVCNIQDGLPSLPGVGRRARIGYNPVSCGPSVCNFAEKQIEITCIEPLDDAQFILPSKHVQSQDTFSIPLIVSDFKDVEAFQFPITWDTTKLELQKIYSLNNKLSNFTLASNFNQHVNGQIRCVYISFNDPISLNTKDTLLFLQFKAISEGCDSTEVKIAKSILNEDNTSFTIEVIRVIENVSVTVNVTTKDSKIVLNKTLCNACSTAIEMVQGVECILPKVISTGEILYPCEYTNGATALPNEVGYKTNIGYIPYEGNQCFSVCLQGTGISIGCVEKKDSCKSYAIQMVQGVECVLPKLLGTGEILYPCQFLNGAELPTTVNSLAIVNIEPFEGSGCFSTCNQGRQVTIGCALPVSDTCRSARVEMVQGVECILPKDLYTGEILYPCEFINGATNLPNVVGEVVNINYEAFSGSGCFSTCLQGRQISVGCILPPSDSCRMATVEMVQGVECILSLIHI